MEQQQQKIQCLFSNTVKFWRFFLLWFFFAFFFHYNLTKGESQGSGTVYLFHIHLAEIEHPEWSEKNTSK